MNCEPPKRDPHPRYSAGGYHFPVLAVALWISMQMTPCLQTTGGDPAGGSSSRADEPSVQRANNPRVYAEGESMSSAPGSPKSFKANVVRTTENGVHVRVDFSGAASRQKMGYFLFQLRGLKGREKVRIDFVNVGRWQNSRTIVPLYARGVEELSDLTALRARPPEDGRLEYVRTDSGQKVPVTRGLQKWHYFKRIQIHEDEKRVTVRKRFPEEMEQTYVAHRTPYTFGHHLQYMKKLKERARYGAEHLAVHEVGKSEGGRTLHVVELASPADPKAKKKPVVVMTAGEHPDEHATYISLKGALSWLLSDATPAKALRRKATFLFIPSFDPDGNARCMYENICYSFVSRYHVSDHTPSSTSNAYVRWFRSWANEGKRLDVIINQHAVESGETASHLFNYVVEPEYHRYDTNMAYWKHVMERVRAAGFRVDEKPSNTGNVYDRLAGFLKRYMQTMQLFVELNTQPRTPARKLTLHEIEQIGRQLVRSTVEFLYESTAKPLYRSIQKKRNNRRKLVERYEPYMQIFREADNPLERESWMWVLPSYERAYRVWNENSNSAELSLKCEDWFKDLYRKSDVLSTQIPKIP